MKLEQYLKDYHEFSGKASDITRQLAFAAIAIIWIFKEQGAMVIRFPGELIFSLGFVVGALISDLLQYVINSIIWKLFHNSKEKEDISPETDIKAPTWMSLPSFFFYFSKIFFVVIGYIYLFKFLLRRM